VNIINFKAYRLSLFLRTGNSKLKASFNHAKVLQLTLAWTAVTAVCLLAIALVDRPMSTRVLVDEYRPKLDYHVCQSKTSLTPALLWILVIWHIVLTVFCISAVRNGIEIFRDGTIIKESFMGLYACLLVAFCMHNLSLSHETIYVVRTIILCMGLLIFTLRLLVSRTVTHLLPLSVIIGAVWLYKRFKDAWVVVFPSQSTSVIAAGGVSGAEDVLHMITDSCGINHTATEDTPVFAIEIPADTDIDEMIAALRDPVRAKAFREIAEKSLATENVDFIIELLQFEDHAKNHLIQSSVEADGKIRAHAHDIFNKFIRVNSPNEVNVSSACRAAIERRLFKWTEKDSPLFTHEVAHEVIKTDASKRTQIFEEKAMREISLVLFQNLWRKFRACEMAHQMANEDSSASARTFTGIAFVK
jgi:hypothetical protein